jgi:Trk K+ transport system NAD-binding subunit
VTDRLRRLREGAPGLVAAARRRVRPRVPTDQTVPELESHFVVCGDDALALRLVEELIRVHRSPVTVILPSRHRNHGPQIARISGIRLIEAERLNTWAFTRARVRTASALALLKQDDVGNMDAALLAQELNPKIRLVIRMFNMSLGHHVRVLLRNCRVLSDASIAAPAFVAAALGEVAPSYVRLPGNTLAVARREDVRPDDVICGLADTSDGGEPVLLPPDEGRCDLVLARSSGVRSARLAEAAARGASVAARARLVGRLRRLVGALVSPGLGLAFLGLLTLLFGAMIAQWLINPHMSFLQAAYVTLLNTVGGASANLDLSGPEQVLQSVVALTGIAVIPVVTAVVVEAVVNARLAFALGSRRGPVAGHVVVVGLGNLGTRAIQQLHDLGVPVTAIDKAESARGTRLVRELGIPLIIGDASRPETLREASVSTAQALLAVSTDDVANLEAALQGRQVNPDLRAVLRLFDGDFADRLQRTFGLTSSKSVSYLAAPAFAAAMQEREVTGTISVKRQVLLVAEIPVQPGSPLDGLTVAEAQRTGEIRAIALANARTRLTTISPPPDHRLAPDDWLIVVATAAGLTRMLAASTVDQKS